MAATIHMAHSVPIGKGGEQTMARKVALERQLQGMLAGLSVQFLLGLALATVAGYDANTYTGNHMAYQLVLVLHMVVALGLVAGSISLVAATRKRAAKFSGIGWAGLVAILVATGSGLARLSVDGEWLTFLMGAGFIAAVALYGRLLGNVLKQRDAEI